MDRNTSRLVTARAHKVEQLCRRALRDMRRSAAPDIAEINRACERLAEISPTGNATTRRALLRAVAVLDQVEAAAAASRP